MKKLYTTLLINSLFISSAAFSADKILQPEKGGVKNIEYTQNKPTLTIANYNIAAGRVSSIQDIAKAIIKLDADVVTLEEVDNKTNRSGHIDQMGELAKLTGMHAQFGKAMSFDGGEYGLGILSKYPIKTHQVFKLPSGDGEQRIVLASEFIPDGFPTPVIVLATHLDWKEDPATRLNQIREIENISVGNTDSNFKDIASKVKLLSGDFNDTPNSSVLKELERYWNDITLNNVDMRTWPAVNPALEIDHILTFNGQKWDTKSISIPNKTAVTQGIDWPSTSDHVPLSATLTLLEQ
ncbi:endonuclease/exonuclease/phosphatase family protein [Photobacterium damselae]|uniref:endonuclease/exonuclease/phosphatase family protein n=1 Tax=Photobacterium damselae TaxID=38293 RepID=UPI001EFE6728|nr:endonuclease/exonuclease/phosphatase family protein [Photobacterium damselae]MCG9780582.1 endonuclease/exonuclease/phosphatase family protein [Photobacterium damselae]